MKRVEWEKERTDQILGMLMLALFGMLMLIVAVG